MRTPRLWFLSLLLDADVAWAGSTLSTTEAAKHIGERATVCGDFAIEHTASTSRGTPTFVNPLS